MSKNLKYLLIISLAILIFLPTQKAQAILTYVSVKINSTEKPGGGSFNLPAGTKLSIFSGTEQKGSTTTINVETPVGSKVWTSSPIELSSGNYTAKLEVPICNGKAETRGANNYCWFMGTVNPVESCTQVCARNSTTPLSSTCLEEDTANTCTILKSFGFSCSACWTSTYAAASYSSYCYYNASSPSCSWSNSGFQRLCACKPPLGTFTFPFTFVP